jgi:hypothetical protein
MPISVIARHTHPGRSFWLLGLLIAALAVSQVPVFAQFASGSIGATVTDATGAVVPAAKVTLKNEATGALRDTVTNSAGAFDFPSILPATYTVTVIAAGLQTFEEQGITLTQGATLRLPTIILQVQSTKQEVEVVAGADVVVPVDSGQASQTLNKNMIENISIAGRDAAELMKIMPGMGMTGGLSQNMWGQGSVPTQQNSGPIGSFTAQGTQPNGGMTMTSDGANLLDPGNQGTQTANINQNQVQEVSILTSAYGAEFAKGPVTFQAIGKSGGAQFHGQGYLYARNGVFDSNGSYNNSQGVQAPTNSFYYPGGDFGGPVLIPHTNFNKNHDKLFFYAAFEYMDQHPAGSLQNYFVPTAQMQAGNFTPAYLASLGPAFASAHSSGASLLSNTMGKALAPTGQIPATDLDPNSATLLKLMPAPNVDPATSPTGTNYQYFDNTPVNRWELRLRGDYNINDKTKLFFSWNHQIEHDENPISIWWQIGGSLPYPSSQNATQVSQVYSANLVHVFSPTLTNEFVFAEATFLNPIILGNPAAVDPSKLGFSINGLFSNPYTPQMPNTYGYGNASVGFATYTYGEPFTPGGANSFGKLSQTPNISDNVTKIQGSHTLKAGFYWDYARNYQTSGSLSGGTQGAADFEQYGYNSLNNTYANWVTGRMNSFAQDQAEAVQDMRYYQYSFFINDQWKASRRLTLTGGLRFEHMGNWVPNDSEGDAVWDPATYNNSTSAAAWTGLEWHSIDSAIPLSGFPSQQFFVEPRFGFAYDLFGTGKTVIRGGAGLFRYQLAYNTASAGYNAPLGIETGVTTTSQCCVGWSNMPQFSPSLGAAGLGSSIEALQMGDSKTPNTWNYNVTISQRVPWRSVAEFQYAGNKSQDMLIGGNGNLANVDNIPMGGFFGVDPITGKNLCGPLVNGACSGTQPSAFPNQNDFYPYHNYTGIRIVDHGSYSNYNAFIATWQKQSGRMTFTMNYTFSKILGIRDGDSDNGPQAGPSPDPFSIPANYGVLSWDHTHIFNSAYVINLPSPVKDSRLLGGVVNGWVLSGITQFQSGAPIQPNTNYGLNIVWPQSYQPNNYLGTNAVGQVMPVLTCDPRSNLQSGQYFNPNCFAPPTGGAQGDNIWPYIKGPAFFNSDLAIYKDFLFKEHQKIEFRFSAFNFLNHPLPQLGISGNADISLNFSGPNGSLSQTNLNGTTNGKALYDDEVPRVIEFAVKYNF